MDIKAEFISVEICQGIIKKLFIGSTRYSVKNRGNLLKQIVGMRIY